MSIKQNKNYCAIISCFVNWGKLNTHQQLFNKYAKRIGKQFPITQQPITFCYSTQKSCSKIWGKIVHTPTQNKIRKQTGQKKTQIVHFINADPKKHNLEPDPRFQLLGSTATLKYLRVFICSFHVNFKKINLMICFCFTVQCLFYIK